MRPIPSGAQRSILLCIAVCALSAACDSALEPELDLRLGALAWSGEPPHVEIPDTVEVDRPFDVRIDTWGGGCTEKGETDVRVAGDIVLVRPYDRHSDRPLCDDILRHFTHHATITLDRAGPWWLRVLGRDVPADTTIAVTQRIVVR